MSQDSEGATTCRMGQYRAHVRKLGPMGGPAEFRYTITSRVRGVIEIQVSGYLTAEDTTVYLKAIERTIEEQLRGPQKAVCLMFIENLSGFQSVKVPRMHGQWFSERGASIARIAVVSSKASVTFGLAAVKLLTKHVIKAFNDPHDARLWLEA
jgi:hypothetical protein